MDQTTSDDSEIDETADRLIKLKLSKVKDKTDLVNIDPRTRIIMFNFVHKQIIDEIKCCISTGKEANVYYATCADGSERAIKIYKTCHLQFKVSDNKYLPNGYRFYYNGKLNGRKMVRIVAEKEMKNLRRIYKAGILCPQPFVLKSHVLLMSFIGEKGSPAPLLKDTYIGSTIASQIYSDCVLMMFKLFRSCKLVHGDLSEYNLLYFKETQTRICPIGGSQETQIRVDRIKRKFTNPKDTGLTLELFTTN